MKDARISVIRTDMGDDAYCSVHSIILKITLAILHLKMHLIPHPLPNFPNKHPQPLLSLLPRTTQK